jgi:hypothetical protein
MERIEVNCETGEVRIIQLTTEEIAANQAQYAEWLATQPAAPPAPTLTELQAQLATLTEQIAALAQA